MSGDAFPHERDPASQPGYDHGLDEAQARAQESTARREVLPAGTHVSTSVMGATRTYVLREPVTIQVTEAGIREYAYAHVLSPPGLLRLDAYGVDADDARQWLLTRIAQHAYETSQTYQRAAERYRRLGAVIAEVSVASA